MLDFDMGKYAGFVWPAWALTLAVFVFLGVRAWMQSARWKRELQRLHAGKNR